MLVISVPKVSILELPETGGFGGLISGDDSSGDHGSSREVGPAAYFVTWPGGGRDEVTLQEIGKRCGRGYELVDH